MKTNPCPNKPPLLRTCDIFYIKLLIKKIRPKLILSENEWLEKDGESHQRWQILVRIDHHC